MKTKNISYDVDRYKKLCYIFDYSTHDTYHTICKNIRLSLKESDIYNENRMRDNMAKSDIVKILETKVHKLSYIHHISNTIKSISNIDELLEYALSQALHSLES